jgi:phosphoribosylformylglycinamidine cyclo-ligase
VVSVEELAWDATAPFEDGPLGEALLTPTRLYVRPLLAALRSGGVAGLAHITGGGLTENLPRVLPEGCGARIDLTAWKLPPVFRWLAQAGGLAQSEMLKTFNAGIGMVVVVKAKQAGHIADLLMGEGEKVYRLGTVTDRPGMDYIGTLS